MKVRVFTAPTMQEAMAQVKNSLGRDAIILHTRRFKKGGVAGFFGHEMIEVMAAVDQISLPPKGVKKPLKPVLAQPAREESASESSPPQTDTLSVLADRDRKDANPKDGLQDQMNGMRQMLEQLLTRQKSTPASPWYDYLVRNEVQPTIAEQLIQGLPQARSAIVAQQPGLVKQVLLDRIGEYFRLVSGIELTPGKTKKVALVGPTGVGKTTTLAKLAARFVLDGECSVALITADTYRIAAVDQLKTYADILNIPLEVVYTPADLERALAKHADKSLVLIDTAGRSPKNVEQIQELQQLLAVDAAIETYLVLSCTTKYFDAVDIVEHFSNCVGERIIFTKLDESTNLGTAFNLLYQFPRLSMSYITIGQNVPDDIELVNPQKLASMLLRDS